MALPQTVSATASKAYGDPIIMGAMLGSLIVVSVADYKKGEFPPSPKVVIATLVVFGILGAVTVSDSKLTKSFAVLIFIGLLVKELPTLTGKGKTVTNSTVPINNPGTLPGGAGFDFPGANPVTTHKHKITNPPPNINPKRIG